MKKHVTPIIAAILLLLPVLYVGSYLALVNLPANKSQWLKRYWQRDRSNYRIGGPNIGLFFWPLEQIDRKVRPGTWTLDVNRESID